MSMLHTLARFTLVSLDLVLAGQHRCYGVQSVEGHLLRLAEIHPVKLALTPGVGGPVPAITLIACSLRTVKVPNALRKAKVREVLNQAYQAGVPTDSRQSCPPLW